IYFKNILPKYIDIYLKYYNFGRIQCIFIYFRYLYSISAVNLHSTRGGLTIWKLGHCPRSVGGPMRCPWYLFHRLF
ncbi:unnamed protein product, partial [Staurois parvus]